MRRHHLFMLVPVLITAGFVGWITAAPGSTPMPVKVAVLIGGPSLFAGVVLGRRWRLRRKALNSRSLFGP
ncbi:hypothetical protein [Nonomuraea endophytica]|uniref:Uncharacterized protein n=1 Tax=Nonomuraea endophytica TaxID=714136 RepID=A0A7W8A0S0_9ACTN|nr:hypothetical protein [Nonomuraea endophytica]MBB5076308.1 hypothetical protein [Nonomuraea endophytica]